MINVYCVLLFYVIPSKWDTEVNIQNVWGGSIDELEFLTKLCQCIKILKYKKIQTFPSQIHAWTDLAKISLHHVSHNTVTCLVLFPYRLLLLEYDLTSYRQPCVLYVCMYVYTYVHINVCVCFWYAICTYYQSCIVLICIYLIAHLLLCTCPTRGFMSFIWLIIIVRWQCIIGI